RAWASTIARIPRPPSARLIGRWPHATGLAPAGHAEKYAFAVPGFGRGPRGRRSRPAPLDRPEQVELRGPRGRSGRGDQPLRDRPDSDLRARGERELAEDVAHMAVGRALGDD